MKEEQVQAKLAILQQGGGDRLVSASWKKDPIKHFSIIPGYMLPEKLHYQTQDFQQGVA